MKDLEIDIDREAYLDDPQGNGLHYELILQPPGAYGVGRVYVWSHVGAGTTERVWSGNAMSIEVTGVTGAGLADWVEKHRAEIEALLDMYEGKGDNGRGHWSEDALDQIHYLRDKFGLANLPSRMGAVDWLCGDFPNVVGSVIDHLREGGSLRDYAVTESTSAESDGFIVSADAIEETLRSWLRAEFLVVGKDEKIQYGPARDHRDAREEVEDRPGSRVISVSDHFGLRTA